MSNTKIIHNPRCSKSRQTLELLKENNIEPEIVLYLDNPLSEAEISNILSLLDIDARSLMRKGESEYKELNLADASLSPEQLIKAMAENPKLIERPIVLHDGKAKIGRPPEQVLELF